MVKQTCLVIYRLFNLPAMYAEYPFQGHDRHFLHFHPVNAYCYIVPAKIECCLVLMIILVMMHLQRYMI